MDTEDHEAMVQYIDCAFSSMQIEMPRNEHGKVNTIKAMGMIANWVNRGMVCQFPDWRNFVFGVEPSDEFVWPDFLSWPPAFDKQWDKEYDATTPELRVANVAS